MKNKNVNEQGEEEGVSEYLNGPNVLILTRELILTYSPYDVTKIK